MKKTLLLISCALLAIVAGCDKNGGGSSFEIVSGDEELAGDVVTVGDSESGYYKLFVLNEGNVGSTAGSNVDFLRYKDGKFVRNAFTQMNTSLVGGLGDTPNDIKIYYNTVWVALTGSGLVEVFSGIDETHIRSFEIPSPRGISFDSEWAYVTSYAGSYSSYDENWNFTGDVRPGALYRISLTNPDVVQSVEVGYQPEGVDVCGNNIYVANSGWHLQAATGKYDNRVTVINRNTFQVEAQIEVADNLNKVFSDGSSNVWVTGQGNFWSEHSGLYHISNGSSTASKVEGVYVSSASYDPVSNSLFVVGSPDEFGAYNTDETGKYVPIDYNLYRIDGKSSSVSTRAFSGTEASGILHPYGVAYNSLKDQVFITDALDFVTNGHVYCLSGDLSKLEFKATSGINPGHPVLYALY